MTSFKFTKMHGLGNDFVVTENVTQSVHLNPEVIQALANRRTGVGCDQVLLISPSETEKDFDYKIFNADGSEALHCGNGARCVAKFIFDEGLSDKPNLTLQLPTQAITTERVSPHVFKVGMGHPEFAKRFDFTFDDSTFSIQPLSIGNPHAVIIADKPLKNFEALGKALNEHHHFPDGVNVSWVHIDEPSAISLQVFERGVGLTQACGSAACAAAATALRQGQCENEITVRMPGGDCTVAWPGEDIIYLSGPAESVYSGVWHD